MKHALFGFLAITFSASRLFAQDFTSGLITHFPLTEATGTTAAETVGGGNGTVEGTPMWIAPGLQFTGTQKVTTPVDTANGLTNAMTLACWLRLDPGGAAGQYIVNKDTFGLSISAGDLWLEFNTTGVSGGTPYRAYTLGTGIQTGVWRHFATTTDGTSVKAYLDGNLIGQWNEAISFGSSSRALILGYKDYPQYGWQFPFTGALRDVRVYNRALSAADLSKLGSILPANYAGLWIGRASLNEVKEAATGNWAPAPAFEETVLLHINEAGSASLLNDATLMQTRAATPIQLVVTQPALLPNYDGVTLRGGRRIGQRFSSATMLLPSDTVPLSKAGAFFSATFTLPAASPVNPFRHKYHPDLGTGRDLTRTAGLSFAAGESPSDNTLTGTFMESFTGLHKTTLEARGPVTFTRVSTSGKLNQP